MSEAINDYARLTSGAQDIEQTTITKISYRLIPILIVAYFFCVLDRVNVSFAALTMNADLSFSPLVYAWGAGIFFFGYFILEIPSNLALHRFGARRWIARIMILWGIISAGMAFVTGPTSFYVTRFLLGLAEAGFFPGIILYLTYWFPAEYRARVMSAFILGAPLSAVIGGPLCGLLLELNGFLGLKGWQWLFITEGIPSVVIGIVALLYLDDRPADARWLSPQQKTWLEGRLANERASVETTHKYSLGQALRSPRVIALGLVYFGLLAGLYGVQFWLPQIVKGFGLSNLQTGFVSALPFAFGGLAMIFWGARSDRKRERVWHIVLALLVSAGGLAASAYGGSLVITMLALIVASMAGFAAFGLFWTLPSALLTGAAAAGGLALINSIGSLAGFGGPYLVGWIKDGTGSAVAGLLFLSVLPLLAAAIVTLLKHDGNAEFGSR
ncbi:MFS transporter [Bradyrhizobium australafricanum]|uniref:MFS transporter n=1 Tax=Bradyrhizobium australafricanum TaxID=2821406 RepID=UPI001CE27B9D|nr:MFS transporter [Bradyrhizobium australafricanum]